MSDETIVTPIGSLQNVEPTDASTTNPSPKRSLRGDVDRLAALLAVFTALVAFGLAVYFFYGFIQTDQEFWTLANAFGLCFGVAGLAYGPCIYFARTANQAAKGQASRRAFALSLLVMFPWVCVSLVLIGWSAMPKIYGISALFLSTTFSIWAFNRMLATPKV